MKKIYLLVNLIILCAVFSCSNNEYVDDPIERKAIKEDSKKPCVVTNLIAGQHHVIGSVSVVIDGDNLIITYTSTGDWTIGKTHLSIGNCDEDWAPLTGSGNPKIGHFEYTEPFSAGPHEVIYIISLEGLDDNYCFAAHAEVEGPDGGETAWAEGAQFDGRSWAMFVESTLSECEDDGGNPNY